jgi:hypothetical protein
LRDLHTNQPAGVALAVEAPTRAALEGLLRESPAPLDDYADVSIYDWEFGGRR